MSSGTLSRYQRKHPEFRERLTLAMGVRRGRKLTPGLLNQVVEVLKSGTPARQQALVSRRTIGDLRKESPTFATQISGLCMPRLRLSDAERAQRYADRLAARRVRPAFDFALAHRESFITALRSDEIYAVAEAAVPRQLPPDMRDDVKSDLVVGLLSGEVRPEDARAAAKRLITRWNAMFMGRSMSMDDQYGDGLTLGGLIADPSSFEMEGTGHRVLVPGW